MYTIHFKYLTGFNFIKTKYKKIKNKLDIDQAFIELKNIKNKLEIV